MVKIKFISLVNLIVDKKIVTELIQEQCNPSEIYNELNLILNGEGREIMLSNYKELHRKMGNPGASEKTAKLMVSYLK